MKRLYLEEGRQRFQERFLPPLARIAGCSSRLSGRRSGTQQVHGEDTSSGGSYVMHDLPEKFQMLPIVPKPWYVLAIPRKSCYNEPVSSCWDWKCTPRGSRDGYLIYNRYHSHPLCYKAASWTVLPAARQTQLQSHQHNKPIRDGSGARYTIDGSIRKPNSTRPMRT